MQSTKYSGRILSDDIQLENSTIHNRPSGEDVGGRHVLKHSSGSLGRPVAQSTVDLSSPDFLEPLDSISKRLQPSPLCTLQRKNHKDSTWLPLASMEPIHDSPRASTPNLPLVPPSSPTELSPPQLLPHSLETPDLYEGIDYDVLLQEAERRCSLSARHSATVNKQGHRRKSSFSKRFKDGVLDTMQGACMRLANIALRNRAVPKVLVVHVEVVSKYVYVQ